MGDVGSTFLGYLFGAVTLAAAEDDPQLAAAGSLALWPFLFDTTFTLVRRLVRGENIFAAHVTHLYQRLVTAGFSHRMVTLLYLALSCMGALIGLLWQSGWPNAHLLGAALMPVMGVA